MWQNGKTVPVEAMFWRVGKKILYVCVVNYTHAECITGAYCTGLNDAELCVAEMQGLYTSYVKENLYLFL